MVEELNESILAKIGSAIAWIFAPLGWTKAGEGWKMAVAAVTGLIAKENVVATFGMLYGFAEVAEDGAEIWGNLAAAMTPIAAYGFLVFNLLCAPCFAAMGAIKREMNNTKWFSLQSDISVDLHILYLCVSIRSVHWLQAVVSVSGQWLHSQLSSDSYICCSDLIKRAAALM